MSADKMARVLRLRTTIQQHLVIVEALPRLIELSPEQEKHWIEQARLHGRLADEAKAELRKLLADAG